MLLGGAVAVASTEPRGTSALSDGANRTGPRREAAAAGRDTGASASEGERGRADSAGGRTVTETIDRDDYYMPAQPAGAGP